MMPVWTKPLSIFNFNLNFRISNLLMISPIIWQNWWITLEGGCWKVTRQRKFLKEENQWLAYLQLKILNHQRMWSTSKVQRRSVVMILVHAGVGKNIKSVAWTINHDVENEVGGGALSHKYLKRENSSPFIPPPQNGFCEDQQYQMVWWVHFVIKYKNEFLETYWDSLGFMDFYFFNNK